MLGCHSEIATRYGTNLVVCLTPRKLSACIIHADADPYSFYANMELNVLYNEDCLEGMRKLPENSVDAVVTDPPYHLTQVGESTRIGERGFMGKTWDGGDIAHRTELWSEVLRVLKPGGHLLSFGGSRTYHRMASAIEDAGFEIRDQLMWIYGSGFPKSLDVSKAIDKAAGAGREAVGTYSRPDGTDRKYDQWTPKTGTPTFGDYETDRTVTMPTTDAAKQWNGWGTALKPSHEPIVLARKPLSEGTVAANVLKHGTGAINIDASRIHSGPSVGGSISGTTALGQGSGWNMHDNRETVIDRSMSQGRWPANVIFDEEAGALLDYQSGNRPGCKSPSDASCVSKFRPNQGAYQSQGPIYGDNGGASRFFYCAKASKRERGEGNGHPTVKPIALMEYLVRLITPPGGVVLDPFAGSGTTLLACAATGSNYIGFERDPSYFAIAQKRIAEHAPQLSLVG